MENLVTKLVTIGWWLTKNQGLAMISKYIVAYGVPRPQPASWDGPVAMVSCTILPWVLDFSAHLSGFSLRFRRIWGFMEPMSDHNS